MRIYRYIGFCLLTGSLWSACTDSATETVTTDTTPVTLAIPAINYAVIKTHPHDTSAFTEGLQVYNNLLYESTGSPAEMPQTRSVIGEVNRETGNCRKR